MVDGSELIRRIQTVRSTPSAHRVYGIMADHVATNPAYDRRLVGWFMAAELINDARSGSFERRAVFAINRETVLLVRGARIGDAVNQRISDELRENVVESFTDAAKKGAVLTPEDVFRFDVGVAMKSLFIPKFLWAGAGFGKRYGFNTDSLLSPDPKRRSLEVQAYWLAVSNTLTELAGLGFAKFLLGVNYIAPGGGSGRLFWGSYVQGIEPNLSRATGRVVA